MIELFSSRSRVLDTLRCNRSRWQLHERGGRGLELIRQAIPLVTGTAVHAGLASLLTARIGRSPEPFQEGEIDSAVVSALNSYDKDCKERGFQLDELESQSFVYNEQRALTEALIRLAGLRVIPRLGEIYEILEVERMDKRSLFSSDQFQIIWRSIPDALLRHRISGDLYLLSWKTCGELPKDSITRVDMEGVSEAWAIQERLDALHAAALRSDPVPGWMEDIVTSHAAPPKIRGVQTVYLVKGKRQNGEKDAATGAKTKKTNSPLIYGYKDQSFPFPKMAWGSMWKCSAPHPMRKSKWYPTGECPGDGRNHQRGDDWGSFPVWEVAGGVKWWISQLDEGKVSPEAGDCLDLQWTMPVPNFRTQEQISDWFQQTSQAELRVARDLLRLREMEEAMLPTDPLFQVTLNESVLGPMRTEACDNWFGRRCPAWDLCHGAVHIQGDPLGSGVYQIKTSYDEKKGVESV